MAGSGPRSRSVGRSGSCLAPGAAAAGDVLVFLPGEREIRDVAELLERELKGGVEVLTLYSRLSWEQQSKIFKQGARRRIVLATNVAPLTATALHLALMRLPLPQRQVLVLYYLADLPVNDIARDCGVSVGTVRTRLAAGRQRLERELRETGEEVPRAR